VSIDARSLGGARDLFDRWQLLDALRHRGLVPRDLLARCVDWNVIVPLC